jgi:ribulose bisphosphate carboxylase small subunit
MNTSLRVYDNFGNKETKDKLDYLYAFFKQCNSNWQFEFLSKSEFKKEAKDIHTQYVKDIITELKDCISDEANEDEILGYEAWINTMPLDSRGLEYHFDCDEGSNTLVTPLRTFVIYLGPQTEVVGGSLALDYRGKENNKEFKSNYSILDDLENGWIQIPFEYARVVSFDPQIPHAVLPIKRIQKKEARITLTIAVWDKEPKIIRW